MSRSESANPYTFVSGAHSQISLACASPEKPDHHRGPSGLMARAEATSGLTVEVLMKQQQISAESVIR
jgi:hypothetical protein